MRDLLRAGASAVLVLAMMVLGGLALWVGVPLGWLYVGSLIQGETGSLGTALAAMAAGVAASIAVIVYLLGWLGRKHADLREARGLDPHGAVGLEGILAVSAGLALIAFAAWFLFFSGSSPIPFQGG